MFPNPYCSESANPFTGRCDVLVTEQREPLEWLMGGSRASSGRVLMNRTIEDERRDYARLMEHLKRQASTHELCRLFSDQFVDDVASQRVHAGLMLRAALT